MSDHNNNKIYLRHFMLYEFRRGRLAREAVESIFEVYHDSISVSQCHIWFTRFREGDVCLEDRPKFGRPEVVDNDVLRALAESDPRQTSEEMSIAIRCCAINVQSLFH